MPRTPLSSALDAVGDDGDDGDDGVALHLRRARRVNRRERFDWQYVLYQIGQATP